MSLEAERQRSRSVVFKYPLNYTGETVLSLPEGAIPVKFDIQNGRPTMWACVPADESECETRKFHIIGTGQTFDDGGDMMHWETFMDGPLVWHVFEDVTAYVEGK